jgi:hypothetical protein
MTYEDVTPSPQRSSAKLVIWATARKDLTPVIQLSANELWGFFNFSDGDGGTHRMPNVIERK